MERRSTRRRTPNKRYTIDAFEGISELQDAVAGAEDDVIDPTTGADADDSGDDFHEDPIMAANDAEDEDEDDDAMSGVDGPSLTDGGDDIPTPSSDVNDDDDDNEDGLSTILTNSPRGKPLRRKTKRLDQGHKKDRSRLLATTDPKETGAYTRGLAEGIPFHMAHGPRRIFLFGPAQEDYGPVYAGRGRWQFDPTLPTREVDGGGFGGLRYHPAYLREMEEERIKLKWKWYCEDGGREAIRERQVLERIGAADAERYMPSAYRSELAVLMGPHKQQKLYKLAVRESVALADAWTTEEHPAKTGYKSGHLLNIGARVQSLDWMPSQSGREQFLAVSTLSEPNFDRQPDEPAPAPAFTPKPPRPSSVQIWQFAADAEGHCDLRYPPHLHTVLCTEWNDIRAVRWCPAPVGRGGPHLLATLSADGVVRVIEVSLTQTTQDTHYLLAKEVAFASRPPDTVCTSITWLSSSRIAAGCANGCLAIWDISLTIPTTPPNKFARPSTYSALSSSYILSITSCYPLHPSKLTATSMTGHLTLTDLTHPTLLSPTATALSSRARVAQPHLVFNTWAQSCFSADDSLLIKAYPLRRWFNNITLGRTDALVTALATSPCHPHLLYGTAGGAVAATNPLRRLTDNKVDVWQQVWFRHEWRRASAAEVAVATGQDTSQWKQDVLDRAELVGGDGACRFTEGFAVERVPLGFDEKSTTHAKDGVTFHVVFELKTAVTALAWNPNLCVGGWAAAGMGSGLLRVEDVAI